MSSVADLRIKQRTHGVNARDWKTKVERRENEYKMAENGYFEQERVKMSRNAPQWVENGVKIAENGYERGKNG